MTMSQNAIPTLDPLARATLLALTRSPAAVSRAVQRGAPPSPDTDQALTEDALRVRGLEPWIPPDTRAGAVLILRGPPPEEPGVAIVGSRTSDAYGIAASAAAAHNAVRAQRVVISGGAEGCDAAAHRAALEVGGITMVVLGGGHDRLYPAHHRALFDDVVQSGGCIASPFWPETPPAKFRFLARNRVIAALSEVIVVARARQKSGALSTGMAGLQMGRSVLAVPGSVGDALSQGPHQLLATGAKPMLGPASLNRELGQGGGELWPWRHSGEPDPWPDTPTRPLNDSPMTADEAVVLEALRRPDIRDLGALQSRTSLAISTLLPTLLELELRGLIIRSSDGELRTAQ